MDSISSFAPSSYSNCGVEWMFDTQLCHFFRFVENGKTMMKKQLREELLNNVNYRTLIRKEYEVGLSIKGETTYIVDYHSIIDTPDECTIIMDYVEGTTLEAALHYDSNYLYKRTKVIKMLHQLLEGLSVLHQHQTVHLDLKPSNIMLTAVNNDVRIIDLGYCYSDSFQGTMGMTTSYASPEQLAGSTDIDARSDIYSLGMIFRNIITNVPNKPWYPTNLKYIVNKCTKQDKEERWQSIDEIITYMDNHVKRKRYSIIFSSFITIATVTSILCYNYFNNHFTDGHLKYVVLSQDSLTCEVVGLVEKQQQKIPALHLIDYALHWGKRYTVVNIGDTAFCKDKSFMSISFPEHLQTIGYRAFWCCEYIESIDIPNSITSMKEECFSGCTGIEHIRLSSNLKMIPAGAFIRNRISHIEIPEGVELIGRDAFAHCAYLKEIRLPKSLHTLQRGVFWNCVTLKTVYIPENVKFIGQYTFMRCPNLKDIYNYAKTPQSVIEIFDDKLLHPITLHVPAQSVELYKNAECWKRLNIVGDL